MRRVLVPALLSLLVLSPSPAAHAAPCWRPPVSGEVIDPFRAPECPYCAGNRGIEFSTVRGNPVVAVAAGHVTWAGTVVDTRYVIVRHVDGRRITYGQLASASVRTGDRVVAGQTIGRSSDRFHFGVRVGDQYRDPTSMLGRLVGRPRLVPIDGSQSRPAPAPRLRCGD